MEMGDEGFVDVRVVSVDGVIGAGKSHLLRDLRAIRRDDIFIFVEPSTRTNKMLALFYTDPARYGAAMQFYILAMRLQIMIAVYRAALAHPGATIIVERCFPADMVFVLANFRLGYFPLDGLLDYTHLMKEIVETLPLPSAFFVLEVPSDEAVRRIRTLRGRLCEQGIEPTYLDEIAKAYGDLRELMLGKGCGWVPLDWSLFGTAEQFVELATAVHPSRIRAQRAIDAIGHAPIDDDEPPRGLNGRVWALFQKFLAKTGMTFEQVCEFHEDSLRKSDAVNEGNAHLDI